MKLRIAHIGDLKGMCFNIPDYQRGYRWETKQVCELLDDLLEFDDSKSGAFYCLQPLVVFENNQNLLPGEKVFDVIDGQQRLTTMFLIINYISKGKTPYRLRYDRACDRKQQPTYNNGEITYARLKNLSNEDKVKNPDYFYLSKAIDDIENWFKTKEKTFDGIERIIEDIIKDRHFKNREKPFYEEISDKDENDNQADVRFIWYNATDTVIDYQGAISVFKRLNYGKTPLIAAELIKALLFQCDVYDSSQKAERKQVAFRMSTEWDRMEKALQDPFMWSMLAPEKSEKISKIDFVLSYIAAQLIAENDLDVKASTRDADYDYIVFDKYIKAKKAAGKCYADIVKDLWQMIQDKFDVIMSWFKERELYHLIGLRLTLIKPKNNKRSLKERLEYNKILTDMFEHFDKMSMQSFKEEQKREIGTIINIDKIYNRNLGEGEKPMTLADLAYGKNDKDLVNILLVYNVTLCLNNSQDHQYFPFWFYQSIIPSLEHIHPQHLHDDDIDFDIRCQWYSEKCKEMDDMEIEADLQEQITKARTALDMVLLLTDEEQNKETKDAVNLYNDKKKQYEANEGDYRKKLEIIDRMFDELAKIDEEELHSIKNMALVDKTTNTMLGNKLMGYKRQKLIKLQNLFNETNGEEGAYTFIGTWKVFNKQFLDVKSEETKKFPNLLFWTKKDRENYFADIEKIYKDYTK